MKKPRYRVVVPAGATLRGLFAVREAARKRCAGASEKNPAHRFYHTADDQLASAIRSELQAPGSRTQGTTPAFQLSQAKRELFAREWQAAKSARAAEAARRWAAAGKAARTNDWRAVAAICEGSGLLPPWEDDRYSKNTEQGRSRR